MHRHIYQKPEEGDIYKFCKCGKRRKIVSIVKARQKQKNVAEKLWKEGVRIRDGADCMVRKFFPDLDIKHSDIYVADHFYPRGDHNLFYDLSNGTSLCSICNWTKDNKSYFSTLVRMAVQEIVRRRETPEKFESMFQIHKEHKPNHDFDRPWYLEAVIKDLTEKREMLLFVTTNQ